MKIVVIGGTGRVGTKVVHRLVAQGHDPVPASPSTGVDTIAGDGLAELMVGADVVIDVSDAPVWDDDALLEFFTRSSRNLLAAERDAGVGHHVALTIVGADRLPDCGYYRAKVAQEAEIEAGRFRTRSCVRLNSSSSFPRSRSSAPTTDEYASRQDCRSRSPSTMSVPH